MSETHLRSAQSLNPQVVAEALETANASAEMNIDAVLAVLDSLLDGLPRPLLNQALIRTAWDLRLEPGQGGEDPLSALAESLGMEVLEVSSGPRLEASPESLWRELLRESRRLDSESEPPVRAEAGLEAKPAGVKTSETLESVELAKIAETETLEAADQPPADLRKMPARPEANAGSAFPENAAEARGKQFLSEKTGENPVEWPIKTGKAVAVKVDEAEAEAFPDDLLSWDNSLESNELSDNGSSLGDFSRRESDNSTDNGAADSRTESAKFNAGPEKNLESGLQFLESELAGSFDNGSPAPAAQSGERIERLENSGSGELKRLDRPLNPENRQMENSGENGLRLSRLEAGGTEAANPEVKAKAAGTSELLDRMENIQRLAEVLKSASRGGAKSLTLALSPPELGKVLLRVEYRNGLVSAFLRVEKPEAVTHLADGLRQLRENLKAQGVELGELDIREQPRNPMEGDGGHRRRRFDESGPESEGGLAGGDSESGRDNADSIGPVEEAETLADRRGGLNLFV